ncbi:PTS sugar transporter subunit IIA [Streptomonospora nanhaiensis]|uniref:Ascorbate-specific PTS system EIIA component n=1 Tax=Streptomonospora nanhaiensis TaxID=1323731 RepID=A0A853BLE0_9ACTN|nr:PTS sugar transporter subunit IIA [Streptomonospora nanhaiensis]MBV2365635.1 PTS sugar transporter subunit IIA [Streptomonospora nanhaiensis]MBX9389041.1 PTS sugar transporter subunit IIA [Streptomonospora nanhaiensis]NYI95535.1 PTS system ascorbate-specific IIA component [Streptomonospora nanhaiensis]
MREPSLSQLLPVDAIVTGIQVDSWRSAIRAAGELLVATGTTTNDYIGQMQSAVDEYGPYIVIAPGLALAHARPSPAVLRTGLSWAGLAEPVEFGHSTNDPVRLVVGLAAVDHDGHSSALSRLARLLADPARLDRLVRATSAQEIHTTITEYESSADE